MHSAEEFLDGLRSEIEEQSFGDDRARERPVPLRQRGEHLAERDAREVRGDEVEVRRRRSERHDTRPLARLRYRMVDLDEEAVGVCAGEAQGQRVKAGANDQHLTRSRS